MASVYFAPPAVAIDRKANARLDLIPSAAPTTLFEAMARTLISLTFLAFAGLKAAG
jgi:hypothetical protein